jgi:hypothetical protein
MTRHDGAWARVSLRITSDDVSADEIAALLGAASQSRTDGVWAVNMVADSAVRLDDQLRETTRYLVAHGEALRALPAGADVSLRISWTPRDPHDGIQVTPELIALLSSVGAYILLDTSLN